MAEAVEEQVAAEETQASKTPGILRDRYTVRSNNPLPDLSTAFAEAFVAEDKRDPNRQLYALICNPALPVRVNVMRALKGMQAPGMVQLVDWGIMMWPPMSRQVMVVIYERPQGKRLITNLRTDTIRIDEYEIARKVVEPMSVVLRELAQRGITHRGIRLTNMFYMDEAGERIAVGDAVTTPPAFEQPILFETIESGMANSVARGTGTFFDDMYSLGVSIALLLLGRNPVAHMDDEAIVRAKIQQGTYALLVGETRLPLPMIELLRGLLCDDPDQRWDLENLDLWMSGRRLSPLQQRHERRAARAFPFNGKEYYNCRELAVAMAKNWDQAVIPIMDGKLELWLRRAVEDKDRAQAVVDTVRLMLTGGDRRGASDLLVCKVLILLDPNAPIRYKGFSTMPDGMGSALAAAMAKKADTKLLAEMIQREVPKLWFEARKQYLPDNSLMEGNFKELRNYLSTATIGFGLERCLYEMNDAMCCQSPLMGEEYVVEMKQFLQALNSKASQTTDYSKLPVDRHMAAFMGARARSDIDRNLSNLAEVDPAASYLALLNLYAVFQYRLGPEQLPALTTWMASMAKPVIEIYHSREKRKELEREVEKIKKRGSVVELFNLVEVPTDRDQDRAAYKWAQAQYQAAEEEIRHLTGDDVDRVEEASRIGKQSAAVMGILIAMASTAITVFLKVF